MPSKYIAGNTILIIDRDSGGLISNWGSNTFIMPHGVTVDKENNIWLTDVGLHQVFKFSHDGKLQMKLGEANVPGNDAFHFDKPTDVVVEANGSFYVSDGYGNSRILKFSASGKFLFQWGKKGNKEEEFDLPHGIDLDKNGNVYVADRENNRIQIFDSMGRFLKQWTHTGSAEIYAVALNKERSKAFATDDLAFLKIKHRGSDILVFDSSGSVQTRFGRSGSYEGSTCWYHDLSVDSDENIYVGDILNNRIQKFRKVERN